MQNVIKQWLGRPSALDRAELIRWVDNLIDFEFDLRPGPVEPRWGYRVFFENFFQTPLLTVLGSFQAPLGAPKWRQNHEKSLLEGHLCASFVLCMHFLRFLSILYVFRPWKIGVFCGTYCKFEVFAFFAVSSPSALWDLILDSFYLHFWAQKSSETLLRGGSEKWWFLDGFFSWFWRFWGPLGGPRGPLGGAIFASFLHFWGSRGQICSCTPLLGSVWVIFDDFGCFQVCFLMFFQCFFWYILWYFFPWF